MIGDSRFQTAVVGPAETAGMSELQSNDKVVARPKLLTMRGGQSGEQRGQPLPIGRRGQRLMRARSTVFLNGRRLATPNQLCAASAELPPTPKGQFRRRSVAVRVPAFHRVDAPAVADFQTAHLERFRERRLLLGREHRVIDRQFQTERVESLAQRFHGLQLGDLHVLRHARPYQEEEVIGCSGLNASRNFFCPAPPKKSTAAVRFGPLPPKSTILPGPYCGCRTNMPS